MKRKWINQALTGMVIFHLIWTGPLRAMPQSPQAPPPAAPQAAPATPAPQAPEANPAVPIALHLENADLLQVVGIIMAELKMNYIVDPAVKGSVFINTLGELRRDDLFPLLQMILRINAATAVQIGNFWRIVPLKDVQRLPLEPVLNPPADSLSADDRVVMNIIPLRYVAAADMTRILTPFLSEGAHLFSYEPGNILILTESSRSMKRTLELVAMFDTEAFTNQRVRLYAMKNGQAGKVAEELKEVFTATGLSGGSSAIRFVPMERINSVLVVTPSPALYSEVDKWLERLDQPLAESGIRMFIYKVENGKAGDLAGVLNQLFGGTSPMLAQPGRPTGPGAGPLLMPPGAAAPQAIPSAISMLPSGGFPGGAGTESSRIRIVPDAINNQLLIQATAQEYEQIRQMLKELDVVPRQVMIDAKIYEVDLTGALSAGVTAFLQNRSEANRRLVGSFAGQGGAPAVSVSLGTLVGRTRELLLFLNAAETHSQARVISAPSILASDNLAASINVGSEIPILTSQALVSGAQAAGTSLFTNTIQNRDTGVLFTITPRINSSGLVTMQIQQEVSSPLPPAAGGIQSPSIQKRSVSTQVVVQDRETIALGGIIQESHALAKTRIPLLGDIPYLGALFGNTSISSQRTELILLITPTVIRDSSDSRNATAELRDKLRGLRKMMEEDEEREKERREKEQREKERREKEKKPSQPS